MVGSAQAISAHGKVSFYFALSCPVTHVIVDRHLHGFTRDGFLWKMHTLDGARGPLVVIIAMSGRKCIERFDSDLRCATRDLGRS